MNPTTVQAPATRCFALPLGSVTEFHWGVRTCVLSVSKLKESEITQMFRVMDQYYEKVSEESFRRDLQEKQKVILLLGEDGLIKGFSTILEAKLQIEGRSFIALFSGDTVLDKAYWGNRALALAFGRHLVNVKWRHPFRRVYWFLISKGFKTYLLMANNFEHYYPRFDRRTPPRFQGVMDCFYGGRYGSSYSAHEGLIRFSQKESYYLKHMTIDLQGDTEKDPKVKFFTEKNPKWAKGEELACVAEVTLLTPILINIRQGLKSRFRNVPKSIRPA